MCQQEYEYLNSVSEENNIVYFHIILCLSILISTMFTLNCQISLQDMLVISVCIAGNGPAANYELC